MRASLGGLAVTDVEPTPAAATENTGLQQDRAMARGRDVLAAKTGRGDVAIESLAVALVLQPIDVARVRIRIQHLPLAGR